MTDWALHYLQQALDETGLSATELARRAKVSPSTITRPLQGQVGYKVSRTTLEKIRAATGIAFPEGAQPVAAAPRPDGDDNAQRVPIYDIAASAGHGAIVDYEAQVGSLALPADYLRRLTTTPPRHLAIISVKGESMVPTLLEEDVVMVDTTKRSLGYDGLFVLRFDEALHVKRVARGSSVGRVQIISDNAAYPPFEREIGEVEVMGKILWVGRKV